MLISKMLQRPITDEDVFIWREKLAANEAESGESMFLGKPERWFEDIHFACKNGHVSGNCLKTELGDRCLACNEYVRMIAPMGEEEFARRIVCEVV
jgi:hypothetical protein